MFNKFVIERILYNFKFKKGEDLKNINGLKRNKIHNFIVNNKIYNEREYILKYYLKNQKNLNFCVNISFHGGENEKK